MMVGDDEDDIMGVVEFGRGDKRVWNPNKNKNQNKKTLSLKSS